MEAWNRGGLRVECAVGAGVVFLDFVGLVTPGVIGDFCRSATDLPDGVYCLLALFDKATLAMTADAFTAPFLLPEMKGKLQIPGAIVCRALDRALFEQHGRQCADIGIVRSVFTRLADARTWCQRRTAAARLAQLSRMGYPSPFQAHR